jgi:hypothetical protein
VKIFELAIIKVRNYKIQQKWMKLVFLFSKPKINDKPLGSVSLLIYVNVTMYIYVIQT